jgi:hypothetical protein
MKTETQILEELRSNGASFTSLAPHWELRAHAPELYEALSAIEPGLGHVYELLRRELPAQRQWAFNTTGALSRPDRHVRAFYIQLDQLKCVPGGRGALAIKGTEPISDNFAQVPKRMVEMWSVFSWTIGGVNREVLEDWALLTQLERFPICEGKPPAVHPFDDAEEEAQCALELQSAYLKRFGRLAQIPTPLFVYRLPEAIRERAVAALRPLLTPGMMALVETQIGAALGVYIYHYPTLPLRVMHLRGDVGPELSYEARHQSLAALSDPAQAVAGWIRLVAELLALGWVPTDPANFSRGYCVMAQNLVVDGGIVDVNSVRPVASFRNAGELEFAVRHTVRELTQSICWYLVGADAGMVRFQHSFVDVYARVWDGLRRELAAHKPPPEIAAIFSGGDGIYHAIDRTFRNFYKLTSYRPQDAEPTEYQSPK